jgi:mRNA-degrading endonuclease YafQ of YafQ-DinJ toxin-antitoxin module
MRTIERTARFKRDYRREAKDRHGTEVQTELVLAVESLARDAPLAGRYRDHCIPVGADEKRLFAWRVSARHLSSTAFGFCG